MKILAWVKPAEEKRLQERRGRPKEIGFDHSVDQDAERRRRVVESCVQAEEIEELARELHQRGRVAFAVCCDSTNRDILGTGRVGSGRV